MTAPVVLYDADCGFCRWGVARVLGWDRGWTVRPVAIGSDEGAALLADLDEAARMGSWHLVDRDGGRTSAGAAIAPLMRLLPGGRPVAAIATRLPRATEALYRAIVRRRGWLGRAVSAGAAQRARRRIAERA